MKDTRDTSTIAVLSRSCLESRETGIIRACTTAANSASVNSVHQNGNTKLTNRTILTTRVWIELPSLPPSVRQQATLRFGKGDLREGTQVKLGEGIFLTVFKTLKQRQAVVLKQPWGLFSRAGQVPNSSPVSSPTRRALSSKSATKSRRATLWLFSYIERQGTLPPSLTSWQDTESNNNPARTLSFTTPIYRRLQNRSVFRGEGKGKPEL